MAKPQGTYVYYYNHGIYNEDYRMTDYFFKSTDGYNEVYYNTGSMTTYGKVYQVLYAPAEEYYTFKRSYDREYDTVYLMEKDDHTGEFNEYNERYKTKTIIQGAGSRKGLKIALGTLVGLVAILSVLVTIGYLYKRTVRRKQQAADEAKAEAEANSRPRPKWYKPRPIPSTSSRI